MKCCGAVTSPSIWSRRMPRWVIWSTSLPRGPEGYSSARGATLGRPVAAHDRAIVGGKPRPPSRPVRAAQCRGQRMRLPGATAVFCTRAASSRATRRRSGSCGRRAATCPSIATSARRSASSNCARTPLLQRDHGHGRRAVGRRCRHHLLRPAADPRADGARPGVRPATKVR